MAPATIEKLIGYIANNEERSFLSKYVEQLEEENAYLKKLEEQKKELEEQKKELEEQKKELEEQNKDLKEKIIIDSLTGLLNKTGFEENTQELIKEYEKQYRSYKLQLRKEEPKGVACLFIDIDGLKLINDNYGHFRGNELLIKSAETIQRTLRPYDRLFLGRWGGDEFISAVPNTTPKEGVVVGERVRSDFNRDIEIWIRDKKIKNNHRITLSMGLCHYNEDSFGMFDMFEKADEALLKAKKQGRNRLEVLKPAIYYNSNQSQS
ncbi:GGDEF domain-containing protein [Candidatus Woesearchaeota archaeon]|nr:GGDEF domain-containing protein [Candidatus Woesearchaeota archaeon]